MQHLIFKLNFAICKAIVTLSTECLMRYTFDGLNTSAVYFACCIDGVVMRQGTTRCLSTPPTAAQ